MSTWKGGVDLIQDDNRFQVSLQKRETDDPSEKEPLILNLCWSYVGNRDERLKAVCNFCGETLIQSFDSTLEHKVFLYSALTLFADRLEVERELPVYYNPEDNEEF